MKRVIQLLALIIPLAILGVASFATSASAYDGAYWDENGGGSYINGWSGGPFVNVYNGRTGNDNFALVGVGNGGVTLRFNNGGSYQGYCIGDSGNSPNNPRSVLDYCGGNLPWGSVMTESLCYNGGQVGFEFKVAHWNAWLGSPESSNGDPFYQNYQNATCFTDENP